MENRHTFKSPLHCTQIFVLWNSDTVKLTLGTYRLTYFNISIDSTTPKKSFLLYFCLFCVCGGGCHTACLWASEDNLSSQWGALGPLRSSCLVAITHQRSYPTSPRENYKNYLRTQKEHTSYEVLNTKAKRKT